MDSNEHNRPPETIKEVGIHLGYMSKNIADLKILVQEQNKAYSTKAEFLALEQRFEERHHEQEVRINAIDSWMTWAQRLVLGLVVTAVIAGVVVTKVGP